MVKVRLLTVKDFSEGALKALQKLGVLHVEEAKELKSFDKAAIERERNRVSERLASINNILSYLREKKEVFLPEAITSRSLDEIVTEVDILYGRFSDLDQQAASLQKEIARLTESKRYLGFLAPEVNLRLRDLNYSGDYLFTKTSVFSEGAYQSFQKGANQYLLQEIAVSAEGEIVSYLVAGTKHRGIIEDLVKGLGAIIPKLPEEDLSLERFLERLGSEIERLKHQLVRIQEEIQRGIKDKLDHIVLYRELLVAENDRLSVLEKVCEANYVTLIEGWVPESELQVVISKLRGLSDYVFLDTRRPKPFEEPPTKLKNPSGIRHFHRHRRAIHLHCP